MEEIVPGVSSRARAALIQLAIDEDAGSSREAATRTGALVQAAELLQYLEITLADYEEASARFVRHVRRQQEIAMQREPGPYALSPEEAQELEDGRDLAAALHLRIETFYVFAKILCDKLAGAIRLYFGPTKPRTEITRHSQLLEKLDSYAAAKGLTSPQNVLDCAKNLADMIAFREASVVHDSSPRSMKGTLVGPDGETKIAAGRIYPDAGETGTESAVLHELISAIEEYATEVVSYLRTNGPSAA